MEFISSDEFGKKINEIYSSSKFEGKLMEFIHQVNLGGGGGRIMEFFHQENLKK